MTKIDGPNWVFIIAVTSMAVLIIVAVLTG